MPFVKLDKDTLNSSLWTSDYRTRIVFLTLLMMADAEGRVHAKAPGIARAAVLPVADVRQALKELEAPDPDSRTESDEGRRIRAIRGGYDVINYVQYHKKDYTAAERQRRWRERQRQHREGTVTASNAVSPLRVTHIEVEERRKDTCSSSKDSEHESAPKPPTPANGHCPITQIIELYHEMLPELPRVVKITGARAANIRARWRDGDLATLDDWRWFFERVRESDFLMGRAPTNRGRAWKADLEWLVKAGNAAKVAEGRYHE